MSAIPLAGSGRSKSFYSLLFMAKMAKAGNYSTLKLSKGLFFLILIRVSHTCVISSVLSRTSVFYI